MLGFFSNALTLSDFFQGEEACMEAKTFKRRKRNSFLAPVSLDVSSFCFLKGKESICLQTF